MNSMVRRSCLIAAPLVLLLGLGHLFTPVMSAEQPPSVETLLGIVDERGLLMSVVRFDGVHWRNSWPEPDQKLENVTLPSSLAAIPRGWTGYRVPARWYAWSKGAAVRPIRVTGPVRYAAACVPGIGLQSDLPPPARPTDRHTWPKKKLAIAVSNEAVRVEPISELRVIGARAHATVRPDTVLERDLLRAAERPFRVLAREAASRYGDRVKLAPWPVRWTKAYRYTLADTADPEQAYLLEGEIHPEHWRGPVRGFLWLKARHGVLGDNRGHAVLDDEDAKMSVRHRPLGVIRIGGHHFWVSEQGGYESEAYQLIDLTSPTLSEVLLASGGGC